MSGVRIISEPLGGSKLSRLLQRGDAPAHWLPCAPASPDAWRARAQRCRDSRDWASQWAVLAPALQASGAAAERLARVIEGRGIVVTTGQQPGLFGGPVYTWSKAMSALALADLLEREAGLPTAAVYWAATDDADWEEASSTVLVRGADARVVTAAHRPAPGTPMSLAPLGPLAEALQALRDATGSAADARPLGLAQQAYGDASHTVGAAFVSLLRGLLEPLGMPVLDASHEAVRAASTATLASARARAAVVDAALVARTKELRDAGHEPQVEHVAGMSLVFQRRDTSKRRLAVREAADAPADGIFSPNVLLRPIVEQAILPTIAYVAGPGELAYFAQVSAAADALGLDAPLALPRWSCTVVEPQVDRLLVRYGATVDDLAAPDGLETTVARAAVSGASMAAVDEVRALVVGLPGRLTAEASPMGLDAAVQGAVQGLQHRLDRLERRLVAGVKRRETAQLRDVATLRAALYPLGTRQERAMNLLPVLARQGVGLLGELRDAAAAHATMLVRGARED